MAEMKTKVNDASVNAFLDAKVTDATVRKDCETIIDLMEKVTGQPAKMWGTAIIGFDSYHYKYDSGREGDMCVIGFSPRKGNISLYVAKYDGRDEDSKSLGKHTQAKGCMYVKKLSDVDLDILETIFAAGVAHVKAKHS